MHISIELTRLHIMKVANGRAKNNSSTCQIKNKHFRNLEHMTLNIMKLITTCNVPICMKKYENTIKSVHMYTANDKQCGALAPFFFRKIALLGDVTGLISFANNLNTLIRKARPVFIVIFPRKISCFRINVTLTYHVNLTSMAETWRRFDFRPAHLQGMLIVVYLLLVRFW